LSDTDPKTTLASRTLEGCAAKIERSHETLDSLNFEWQAFLKEKPHPIVFEHGMDSRNGGKHTVLIRCGEMKPPPPRFAVLIGEMTHNLRSALDHVIWPIALAGFRNVEGREPKKREARKIQFPIFDEPAGFDNAYVVPYLSEDARTIAERHQPYHRGEYFARHPLRSLASLSNEDKHRSIVTSAVFPDPFGLVRAIHWTGGAPIEKRFRLKPGQPLESGTVIAQLTFPGGGPQPEVYMKGQVRHGITFGENRGESDFADDEIPGLIPYVEKVISEFKPILEGL
jgi:hypothetical protein